MAKRRALITGVNGQDGSYLAEWLLAHDYQVFGTDKSPQPAYLARTCKLEEMLVADLSEPDALGRLEFSSVGIANEIQAWQVSTC
jgi:GDP-D-mannose dehydratase